MLTSMEPSPGLVDVLSLHMAEQQTDGLPAAALDNFIRVFVIKPEDRVLLLLDKDLDPRVSSFIWDFAQARGASVRALYVDQATAASIAFPQEAVPLIEDATFIVSTWFSSIMDPYFITKRRENGQRWVKITYFRSLDLLKTEAAAFPLDVMSQLLTVTAEAFDTQGQNAITVTDPRGTELHISMSGEFTRQAILRDNRWRGELTTAKAGAYVHYIPTHGPNLYQDVGMKPLDSIHGTIVPQWSVGFDAPFGEPVRISIDENRVTDVVGRPSEQLDVLAAMLPEGRLIELGCGFNPKWPRNQIYPAGSNSAGAIHFGLDLTSESDWIKRVMPNWNEPPVHMDLVDLDATIEINGQVVVDRGYLCSLRDPRVTALAARYGNAIQLLEAWPQ